MTTNKNSMWVIFYGILFLIGIALIYSAYTQYSKTRILISNGIKTTATVIDLLASQSDNSTVYKPVFEFTDRLLTKRTFESNMSSSPAPYKIGEKVKIIYHPKSEEDIKIISFWGLYRWSVILCMISAPFLIIGGSYLFYLYY